MTKKTIMIYTTIPSLYGHRTVEKTTIWATRPGVVEWGDAGYDQLSHDGQSPTIRMVEVRPTASFGADDVVVAIEHHGKRHVLLGSDADASVPVLVVDAKLGTPDFVAEHVAHCSCDACYARRRPQLEAYFEERARSASVSSGLLEKLIAK